MIRRIARRLLPDSIAARTAATVVLALFLTQAVSALIYLTDRPEGPPVHSFRVWVGRVSAIVQLVESTPQAERPRVVRALDDPILGVDWRDKAPRVRPDPPGMPLEFLRRRVRQAIGDPDRPVLIEMRHDRGLGPPRPLPLPDDPRGPSMVRLFVQLTDGSWLVFTSGEPPDGPFQMLRFGLWMAGIVAVVAALSLWAARRLTAPLAGFAAASERLGVDGEAAPLAEVGPRELRTATRAFNLMQERLRRFVADRTQMLAAISHDLRTPLTRLRLRAELVEDPEMQRKMLADLDEMEQMIKATLAFARDDAQKEPRGPLDLADLLQSLCDDRVDAGCDATYQGPGHLTVDGRPVALRRALANLMDNAIAYGGGCRVGLAAEVGNARITIDDDGPGIPVEEAEKVFAPFYRLERSRSRDTGGVGLGLSTARTILRRHGGDVTLANRPEGGLRATVLLPR
ncbi:HAMP domain-containing protein [Azospirillum sp. RWY-5-1]|uniref:histidine kinase n=1 Tax=Azospirillum oleiclasticum TaxID=2735135 RepID=A0ABX2T9I8_9PROT|nr:ATP-binding protein [Azospirillum oleiclasticum]NYZ13324.1 HAMP domain-containing protein [Azospirillum oleiclasticum]NYZ20485.1 HAMP domain-containing protein [Azospirillum oleiclasticum]